MTTKIRVAFNIIEIKLGDFYIFPGSVSSPLLPVFKVCFQVFIIGFCILKNSPSTSEHDIEICFLKRKISYEFGPYRKGSFVNRIPKIT